MNLKNIRLSEIKVSYRQIIPLSEVSQIVRLIAQSGRMVIRKGGRETGESTGMKSVK